MYFSQLPTLLTQLGDTQISIDDIFVRVRPALSYVAQSSLLIDYYVRDGQRPEDVAFSYYRNAEYHWVILIINNIVDPRIEWPMADADVATYTSKKYGKGLEDIHHYRTVNGNYEITGYEDLLFEGVIESVTNYQYEIETNEAKRHIKVLDPQYLSEFVSNFTSLVKA